MEKLEVVDNNKHRYWRAVFVRLHDKLVKYGCDHSLNKTEQILMSLPGVDVGGTLDFFMKHGGYCDCEVFYNVFANEPDLKPAR